MRIGFFTWSTSRIGGTETYLDHIIGELGDHGHEVALLHESGRPDDPGRIRIPADVPTWSIADRGGPAALGALREWAPDVIYSHGSVHHVAIEGALPDIAPSVFFAHNYHGTCISGSKTVRRPVARPCSRVFGAACLVHYFPRGCGGRNPVTMWEQYRIQTQRLDALRRFDRIVVVSAHMREEYVAHGFDPGRVTVIPYVSASPRAEVAAAGAMSGDDASLAEGLSRKHRLLFIGRMDRLKGGEILLAALPTAARALDRSLHLTFVGDGPERARWEVAARRVQGNGRVTVEFAGFLPRPAVAAHLDRADLLVLPSLWPEPFGRVGPEAGEHGVPTVAFDVGGVREWLDEGVSGVLAPGDPPTAAGLSAAIVGALADPVTRRRLSDGARRMAARFTNARHLEALLPLLEEVRGHTTTAGARSLS